MSQMRKNLKVSAIVCLIIGLIFGVLTIVACIGLVGTTAQGTNGAIPEGFVDVGAGAVGTYPLVGILIKAMLCAFGLWAGWSSVQGGNVPSQAKTSLIACAVSCVGYLGASAYFWWIDLGVDTASLLFALVGAVATLLGVIFSRSVYNTSLDEI